jgi:hypothetical protein
MYYLVGEHANVDRRIVTEEHPTVQMHLKESNWDAERIIKWMWGIEKKSENLYDLIEEGDLIAFDYMNTGVIDIEKVVFIYKQRDGEVYISTRGYLHNNEKIQAIYKLNSKGDYIKVWERDK